MKTLTRSFATSSFLFLACLGLSAAAQAQTYTTAVVVPYDPTAGNGNFSSPTVGSNTTAYTVRTGADANNFYVDVSAPVPTTNISGLQFANLYLTSAGHSDGLIFAIGSNGSGNIIDLNTSVSLSAAAVAASGLTTSAQTNDFAFSVPFSFLESNPFHNGFAVSPGDLVRLSYSQTFGYTFVGGSANYPVPTRLGGQFAPAANSVPDTGSTLALLALATLSAFAIQRRVLA